jgi:hypothetical protein
MGALALRPLSHSLELVMTLAHIQAVLYQELLAAIHDKAANCLAMQKMPLPPPTHADGLFGAMEEIWKMTREAWEAETGEEAVHP